MADKLKPGKSINGRIPSKSELERITKDLERHGKNSAEHAGYAAQATAQFIEKHNLERQSFGMYKKFAKMERAKMALVWDQLNGLMDVAGYSDTENLFTKSEAEAEDGDDGSDSARRSAEFEEAAPPPPPPDDESSKSREKKVADAVAAERNARAIEKGIKAPDESGKKVRRSAMASH